MTSELLTLDPEVEGLLREIARQPSSMLLSVPRRDIARSFLDDAAHVSAHSAGWNEAERHLIQVHREELAFALRCASWHLLNSAPAAQHIVVDRAFALLATEIPGERGTRISASAALRGSGDAVEPRDAIDLLERCAASEAAGWPDAGMLAVASFRLVPTDAARIYAALQAVATGSPSAALVSLRPILRGPAAAATALAAWIDASLALARLGDVRRALDAARAAARIEPTDVRAQANRVWIAARARADEEVAAAVRALAEWAGTEPLHDASLAHWYRAARAARRAEIAPDEAWLTEALRDAPPAVRRIFRDET